MDVLLAIFYLIIIYIGYKIILRLLKIPQISDLGSRYILVTGCDTGFGNAITKRLDAIGCHVIAACLTEKGETELRKACSDKVYTIHLDVSNSDSVKKALDQVKTILPHGQGLWGLINNAGIIGRCGTTEWLTVEDYKHCLSVNLFGLIDVAMTFLPLIKKEKGRIVNTASMAGRIGSGVPAPYHVSKYGVEAFSDGLRRDLSGFGVSVSIIEPTLFLTGMTQKEAIKRDLQKTFDELPDNLKEIYGQEYVEAGKQGIDKANMVPDISPVLDAYTHALLGLFPQARYTVGKGVYLLLLFQSLPEWIGDRFLGSIFFKNATPRALK